MRASVVTLAALAVTMGGCFTTGSCDDEERAEFAAIDHYGDGMPTPEAHPYGVCATVVTATDPDAVIRHYQAALADAGYDVGELETIPMADDGGAIAGRSLALQATRGDMTATVQAEVVDGADSVDFQVFVGRP